MVISVWFTWGVLDKFTKQETSIRTYEEKIESHPTIALCRFVPWEEYQTVFNITYTTYQSDGLTIEDEVVLKIGGNYLNKSGDIVNLVTLYTEHDFLCYAINTTRNVDEMETEIKVISIPFNMEKVAFFTSDKNSYGVTKRDWREGEVYSVSLPGGIRKDITLTVEKNINLKCSEESFYEYVASKLSEKSLEMCNETCLMTSLPNNQYSICSNYQKWYPEKKSSCSFNLIQNTTNHDDHPKTCLTTQYSGLSLDGKTSKWYENSIKYKFALPLKAKVFEEYFIIDSIGLIGSVGGTLGMFIGFCFSNLIISIIECIQLLMERKLGIKLMYRNISTKNIWKCLEWIIYFSLMATAIIFAREVIEKFFGQYTGIKQNKEKIESHPTIIICPFLRSPYEGN